MAGIKCCHGCVAPKRHPGCHDHCEEYKKERDEFHRNKEIAKEKIRSVLTEHDFNKIGYANEKKRRSR